MADLTNSPYSTHPTGWFMVGWSWDLAPGEVRPMKIFDTEIVLYRTEEGDAHVVDAYCPHLGAHMGHGGCVVGENLQCPWHGWQWSPEGRNVHIPFADNIREDGRVRQWEIREHHHIIHVWHDALGRDPFWEWPGIPEFEDREGFYQPDEHPVAATSYGVLPVTPYIYIENAADVFHFPFVHGATEPVEIQRWEEISEHYLQVTFKLLFGGNKPSTWLTPDGPTYGTIENDIWGLGLGVPRFEFAGLTTAQLVSVTPVDDETSLAWSTVASTREPDHPDEPGGRSLMMMEAQAQQLRQDFDIWENLRYTDEPLWSGADERLYVRLRKWRDRFYPADAPEPAGTAD